MPALRALLAQPRAALPLGRPSGEAMTLRERLAAASATTSRPPIRRDTEPEWLRRRREGTQVPKDLTGHIKI